MKLRIFSLFLFITLVLADTSTDENDTTDEAEETTEIQCDKSLFRAKDLQDVIKFVENSLSTRKRINDTIQFEAVPVRNKYIQRFNSSIQWFIKKPEHLRDILEEVSETRQNIIKFAASIEKRLINLPYYTSIYQQKLDEKKKILNKFIYYTQVCKINCGPQKVVFRRAMRDSTPEQYCGSITEVHTTIRNRLENFKDKYVQDIHQEIMNAEQDYNMKIKTRVNDLKEVALEEFTGIMFHILNLQDMYYHLKKELTINENWQIELEQLNIKADVSCLSLKKLVMDYVNNCKTCYSSNANREEIEERQQVYDLQNENLLDLLINNELNDIRKYGETELSNIFHELDESLKKVNTEHILVSQLTPIQKEIMELTKREINAFNDLRISNVKKTKVNMDLVKKLIADTKEFPVAISKKIEEIRAYEGEL